MERKLNIAVKVVLAIGIVATIYIRMNWDHSINNPKNDYRVTILAGELGIEKYEVKQYMYNRRYGPF